MRTICEVIKATLDETDVEHIATVANVEQLTNVLCGALRAEGYAVHATPTSARLLGVSVVPAGEGLGSIHLGSD